MKKYLISLCLSSILSLNTEAQPYNFSQGSASYQYLTNPISLNNQLSWDDPFFTIPIGFNFNYFGAITDTVYIAYGFGASLMMRINAQSIASFLSPFGADLIDRGYNFSRGPNQTGSLSPIAYQLSGNPSNRILKIEWKNAGFYNDLSVNGTNAVDSVNFQLWIYESSNVIEMHYGPSHIGSPQLSYSGYQGTDILLAPNVDLVNGVYTTNYYCLSGTPHSPSLQSRFPSATLLYLQGDIPNGMIYRFSPATVGAPANKKEKSFQLFPNPVKNRLKINLNQDDDQLSKIQLYSTQGRLLKEKQENLDQLDFSGLAAGTYLLTLYFKNAELIHEKIIYAP